MSIISQIRAVASKKKDVPAINFEDVDMTYEELMQRVDGLAYTLQSRHIGRGNSVAIALTRSFEMIVAILGVMASGAIYVPLDTSNPEHRIKKILIDSKSTLLLSEANGESVALSAGIERLAPGEWLSQGPIANPENVKNAYLIYTSGSSGVPKGVEVSLSSLENYLKWATTELHFTGGGVPLFTSIAYDHAVTNIFPPLLKGDKIVLLPDIKGGRSLGPALLSKIQLTKERYSYVKITPSLFCFLDKEQRAQLGKHTEQLIFGGEKLMATLISDARRYNPKLPLINHYGPTETTVGCCVYKIPEEFLGSIVPIGNPIPGVEASIRRSDYSIIDCGEPGELFITGAALANGYWERPELNAKQFLNLPDDRISDRRWYRTGDLVCRNAHRDIEYLGRIDDQIKILGNRIEPEEIIESLHTFPNLNQVAVFAHDQGASTELIVAISFFNDKPDAEKIRNHLLGLLPSFMVPKHYLILDEIPISKAGKINIRQLLSMLPSINNNLSVLESVRDKFREVLFQENIGYEDDYFLLGGDSLSSIAIATWAAERYSIPIDMWCVFEFPTVVALSEHIQHLITSSIL